MLCTTTGLLGAQQKSVDKSQPWMNPQLSPEKRAELVLQQMTFDEKISMLHGEGMAGSKNLHPEFKEVHGLFNGGAGLVITPTRLGIPMIQMSDAA